jgi:LuxR family transcriptional regulator, maltose regulon positive regulatory protein
MGCSSSRLDRRRIWFRYHDLFREFLLAELQRAEPYLRADLHERAADWYRANERLAQALEHLLLGDDLRIAAELATELALPTYGAGRLSTIQRWLDTLGDGAVEVHPPLGIIAGWLAALTGDPSQAARRLAQAEETHFDGDPKDGSASFDSARAMLRALLCQDGPGQMLADASFAVSLEPAWSPWRDTALWQQAEAQLMLGDREAARASFRESIRQAEACGVPDCIVLGHVQCALLCMEENQWGTCAGTRPRRFAGQG